MMKKIIFATLVLMFVAAGTSLAYPVSVNDSVWFNNGEFGTTGGGEFDIVDADDNILFKTFCLEYNEHVNYSAEFKVSSISAYAYGGGTNTGVTDPYGYGDPISKQTQWLYWNYVTGDLEDTTDYTRSDVGLNALQRAIWSLEEELATTDTLALALISAADAAVELGADLGDVAVMNITFLNGTPAQSQLIANAPVPEPATLILLGSGLTGLAFYRRKKK